MAHIKRLNEASSFGRNEYCVYEYAAEILVTKGRLAREIRSRNVARMPDFLKSFGTFAEANDYAIKTNDEVHGTCVMYDMNLFNEIEEEYANLNYKEIVKEFNFFDPSTLDIVEDEYMLHYAKQRTRYKNSKAAEVKRRPARFNESVATGTGNMEVKVTYRVESYIKGNSLAEIKSRFEDMRFPNNMEFVELVSVEDADTYNDLMDEWEEA